jgi:hypothetical protein
MSVKLLFRIDIGFDPERGYACTVTDVVGEKQKGIRGNSIEQLVSRIRNVLLEEMHKRKSFPLESERSRIITPNGFG